MIKDKTMEVVQLELQILELKMSAVTINDWAEKGMIEMPDRQIAGMAGRSTRYEEDTAAQLYAAHKLRYNDILAVRSPALVKAARTGATVSKEYTWLLTYLKTTWKEHYNYAIKKLKETQREEVK